MCAKTEDEIRRESYGPLYNDLYHEVVWLHLKWREFRALYAKSEERIHFLNETAQFFFGMVQEVLGNDVLLHVARLTENSRSGKRGDHENLTLHSLKKEAFTNPNDPDEVEKSRDLRRLIRKASKQAEIVQQWRHRYIAHRDSNLKASPLPDISHQQVEEALESIRNVMNVLDPDIAFERSYSGPGGDADSLVYRLSWASWTLQKQNERLRSGRLTPEDLEQPPAV